MAPIVAIAVSGPDTDVVLDGPDERSMLTELDALLADLQGGVLVTWNGSGFDLPFIATRAAALGVAAEKPTGPRWLRPPGACCVLLD